MAVAAKIIFHQIEEIFEDAVEFRVHPGLRQAQLCRVLLDELLELLLEVLDPLDGEQMLEGRVV